MDKADRDQTQAIRAEDECRQLIVQFPNSKYVDETRQLLRNIQEAIAEGEYLVGNFYYKRGDNSAAANRLSHVVEQYPLYSKADLALWDMGEAYGRLGTRFRKQEGEAYSKIVRDYPLSDYADDAARLKELRMPVPEADKGAGDARMQYEKDHEVRRSIITRGTQWLKRGPDMSTAARSGDPAMTTMRPSVPPLVPQAPGATGGAFNGEVTAERVGNSTALDTKPDARANPPAAGAAPAASGAAAPPAADASQPQTHAAIDDDRREREKEKKSKKQQPAAQPADAAPAEAAAQPAAAAQSLPLHRIRVG